MTTTRLELQQLSNNNLSFFTESKCCKKVYKTKQSYDNHLFFIHNEGNKPYDEKICTICNKIFSNKEKMIRHINKCL